MKWPPGYIVAQEKQSQEKVEPTGNPGEAGASERAIWWIHATIGLYRQLSGRWYMARMRQSNEQIP
jgi:hypothetical protein